MTKKPQRVRKTAISRRTTVARKDVAAKSAMSDDVAESSDGHRKPASPFLVVGVGGSAGGMDAFIQILRNLPDDLHATFIFVCHLDPHHESALTEIFQRESKLPVLTVSEAISVKRGHVYVSRRINN
jgi:two-component system CheB/CheR fusion protein